MRLPSDGCRGSSDTSSKAQAPSGRCRSGGTPVDRLDGELQGERLDLAGKGSVPGRGSRNQAPSSCGASFAAAAKHDSHRLAWNGFGLHHWKPTADAGHPSRERPPRVLVVLDSSEAWARGVLGGFAPYAHERGWVLFHFQKMPSSELAASELRPDATLLGPSFSGAWPRELRECVPVAVNVNRRAEGIVSIEADWDKVAELAASHLMSRGYRLLTTYRAASWGVLRERHFREFAASRGAELQPSLLLESAASASLQDGPAATMQWLTSLPKPCGVFALCDAWARTLARYARAANLRVPDDVALVGVDNDVFECEVESPPLSSVAVPWRTFGETAARLVQLGLRGEKISKWPVSIPPLDVVTRLSSDGLAIEDPLVAAAVRWIRTNYASRMSVPTIATAVHSTRQRLERRFRKALGHTIVDEVRRARVEAARRLLWTTRSPLIEVASKCGFTNAALLSVAFRREVGLPPGAYRRRARNEPASEDGSWST